MAERILTIWSRYRAGMPRFPNLPQVPLIELSGSWLAEAGLSGGRVKVRSEYGRLVVTLLDSDVPDSEEV